MCSSSLKLALFVAAMVAATPVAARELRVCADPNNLPFSNERGEGFENKIVAILAEELGATVEYTWWAQRRGFFRNTLRTLERAWVRPRVAGWPDLQLALSHLVRDAVIERRVDDGLLDAIERLPETHLTESSPTESRADA